MNAATKKFELKVFKNHSAVIRLRLSAFSDADAQRRAENQGFNVLYVREAVAMLALRRRKATLSATMFATEVLALLRAGLTLPEVLSALRTRDRSRSATEVIEQIDDAVRQGRTLSNALSGSGAEFPSLFVATVRSSEQTGNLVEALTRYLEYDRQTNALRSTLISASIYPAILLVVGAIVVAFLLGYVIPRFSRLYSDLGDAKIPLASRMLMQVGVFVDHHRPLLGVILGALLVGALALARWPPLKLQLNRLLWAAPVVGERLRVYALARLSHTLSMLLKGGVPFVLALDMAMDVLQSPALRERLGVTRLAISQGQPIAATFVANGLTTEIGARLLAAGERTGNMAEMTEHAARFFDEELAQWIQRATRLFEPLLMTAIGVTIGVIVMLMYLPIFGLASSIE